MKILLLDIETAPNTVYTWGLFKQNIAINQNVELLEEAYMIIRPWIRVHPSHGAFGNDAVCPKCGSDDYQPRGFVFTNMLKYQRYRCNGCGGWFRSNKTISTRREERMANIAA